MKNFARSFIKMLPFIGLQIIVYYLLPLLLMSSDIIGAEMLYFLYLLPWSTFIIAVVYGFFRGFNLFYAIIVLLMFIPAIILIYNSTAFALAIYFGFVALVGNFCGSILKKTVNRQKHLY